MPGKAMDCGLAGVVHSRANGSTFDLFALNAPKEPGKVSNWCLHKALEVGAGHGLEAAPQRLAFSIRCGSVLMPETAA